MRGPHEWRIWHGEQSYCSSMKIGMQGGNPAPDHNVPRVIETSVRIWGDMNIILMLPLSVAHVICG